MIREFKAAFNYKLNEQITECDFIGSLTLLKPLGFPSKTRECETDGIPKGSSDFRVYIYLKKKISLCNIFKKGYMKWIIMIEIVAF